MGNERWRWREGERERERGGEFAWFLLGVASKVWEFFEMQEAVDLVAPFGKAKAQEAAEARRFGGMIPSIPWSRSQADEADPKGTVKTH